MQIPRSNTHEGGGYEGTVTCDAVMLVCATAVWVGTRIRCGNVTRSARRKTGFDGCCSVGVIGARHGGQIYMAYMADMIWRHHRHLEEDIADVAGSES